jgi:hypothetical protein
VLSAVATDNTAATTSVGVVRLPSTRRQPGTDRERPVAGAHRGRGHADHAGRDRSRWRRAHLIITGPAHGTLGGIAPAVTYLPAANYNGADSFTIRASDGQVNSNTAAV